MVTTDYAVVDYGLRPENVVCPNCETCDFKSHGRIKRRIRFSCVSAATSDDNGPAALQKCSSKMRYISENFEHITHRAAFRRQWFTVAFKFKVKGLNYTFQNSGNPTNKNSDLLPNFFTFPPQKTSSRFTWRLRWYLFVTEPSLTSPDLTLPHT